MVVADESIYQDFDESIASSRSSVSPRSPGRKLTIPEVRPSSEPNQPPVVNKIRIMNDMGQMRLTSKMRGKERELRTLL